MGGGGGGRRRAGEGGKREGRRGFSLEEVKGDWEETDKEAGDGR